MRRLLDLCLWLLVFLPVPVIGWLGEQGIRSLGRRDQRLRSEEALQEFAARLAADLEAAWEGRPSGPLSLAGPPIPWDAEQPGRASLSLEPSGEAFGHPVFLRAASLGREGKLVEALDLLSPWTGPDRSPDLRAVAWSQIAALWRRGQEPDKAQATAERMIGCLEDAGAAGAASSWHRWAGIQGALGPDPAQALEQTRAWVSEVEQRATTLEEISQLATLCGLLQDAGVSGAADLAARVQDRRRWPEWSRRLQATPEVQTSPSALRSLGERWFVLREESSGRWFRPLDHLEDWMESYRSPSGVTADPAAPAGTPAHPAVPVSFPAAPLESGLWSLHLAALPGSLSLPPQGGLGLTTMRGILGGCLLAYAILGVLLVGAVLRQRRQTAALLQAREDLIVEVTHELRTPLTVLRMYAESLSQGRIAADSRDQYLSTIRGEARRLGDLVDRVAEAARRGAPAPSEAEPLDPRPVLEAAATHYRFLVEASGGSLFLEARVPPETRVLATEEDLRRILEVLLDNAVAYCPAPVTLHVAAARHGAQLEVTVRDHGPGIPEEERDRVLERWVRGSAGRAGGRRGAGMGLALARETAEHRGGTLTLEFPEDGGTRARLVLPVLATTAEPG